MSEHDPKPTAADILAFEPNPEGSYGVIVPVVVTLPDGRVVETAVALHATGVSAADLERNWQWTVWAAETLRPELVDQLARSYLPYLKDFTVDTAVERLVRAREQLLQRKGASRPLSAEDLVLAKVLVGIQLEDFFAKGDSPWQLACHALMGYTLIVWAQYEKFVGPGAVAQLRRDGRLEGVTSIATDQFAVVTGPRFRESIPEVVRDALFQMRFRSLRDVEVSLGLPVDDPDNLSVPPVS